MKSQRLFFRFIGLIAICAAGSIPASFARAAEVEIRSITFPTDKTVTFIDSFGDARSSRVHEGIDLMGAKMTPLYAAVNGYVQHINDPEASWGYAVTIEDADGYTYHYLHINNDTPGTDDGDGGTAYAYAPGIERGTRVTKGQLIGWMGDSGNAENVGSHLHFEIRLPDETAINAYVSLNAALNRVATYDFDPAVATSTTPDINTDKGYVAVDGETPPCVSGSLIRSKSVSAVYYCGADGKRHAFPHERVYVTWYKDFSTVKIISDEEMAAIPLGKNVTYRPGSKMVKVESMPNVYAVDRGGVLRWITTPEAAATLYGKNWAKNVDDVSSAFFGNYKIGEPVREVE